MNSQTLLQQSARQSTKFGRRAKLLLTSLVLLAGSAAPARLLFESTTLDATVPIGTTAYPFSFTFLNSSNRPITVSRVVPSCGCTAVKTDQTTYAPGQSGTLEGLFDVGERSGVQTKHITVYTDDPSDPEVRLTMNFRVPLALEADTRALIWRLGAPATAQSLTLRQLPESPITLTRIVEAAPFSATWTPFSAETNQATLTLTPPENLERMTKRFRVLGEQADGTPVSLNLFVIVR